MSTTYSNKAFIDLPGLQEYHKQLKLKCLNPISKAVESAQTGVDANTSIIEEMGINLEATKINGQPILGNDTIISTEIGATTPTTFKAGNFLKVNTDGNVTEEEIKAGNNISISSVNGSLEISASDAYVAAEANAVKAAEDAKLSEISASGSADNASKSALDAANSAKAIGLDLVTSSQAATDASKFAGNAEQSAITADDSASKAGESQTAASNSATKAAEYESAASGSANAASLSATAAGDSAGTAADQAIAASNSATNASESETAASGSASNAAKYETAASNSATNAGKSETAALNSATNASQSESAANGSATKASEYETAALQAKTNAEAANSAVVAAATSTLENKKAAETAAETATQKASSCGEFYTQASRSAEAAAGSAEAAAGSATTCTSKATTCTNAANKLTQLAGNTSLPVWNNSGTFSAITSLNLGAGEIKTTGNISGGTVEGAIWNDLTDSIEIPENCELDPGYCYCFDGINYYKSTKYLDSGIIGIHSDTSGFNMGRKGNTKEIDIAVAGFVLAYVDKIYKPGTPLTCTKDGKLTEIKLKDKRDYPERIIGTFWRGETAEEWGSPNKKVKVNGRSWIKIK